MNGVVSMGQRNTRSKPTRKIFKTLDSSGVWNRTGLPSKRAKNRLVLHCRRPCKIHTGQENHLFRKNFKFRWCCIDRLS